MIMDVLSTKIAMLQGHHEQNPIMEDIVNNTIVFILLKLVISGVIILMMKKCITVDRKCATYGMRILTALMLFVVIGNFAVIIGSAESGTLIMDASSSNSYISSANNIGDGQIYLFTKVFFDVANYNKLSKIDFVPGATTNFPSQSDSTTFTITSGGTGSGTVTYNSVTRHIIWYFVDGNITSSPVTISYAVNIFSGFTAGITDIQRASGESVSVSRPLIFSASDGTIGSCKVTASCTYIVQTQKTFTNSYLVTYSQPNLFTVLINKSASTVNSKISISNYTYAPPYYFIESTYNTVGFNYTGVYANGISIKMNDSVNNYDIRYVNATGCSGCTIVIPPEERVYPSTGANIYTDKASYVVGDNINVEWFIADDPYNNLLSECEFIVNDEMVAQSIRQNDNYTLIKPSIGVKKLQIGCGIFSSTIVAEKSVIVIAESQSYITIQNGTAKAGSLNNFTYKWGFTPSTYRWLNIYKFDVIKNSWVKESSNSIQLASIANTIYNSSALVKSDGKYYAEICDNNRGCPTAKILFNSVYEANTPIYSYGYSNISILNPYATYAQNDWITFNTRIDGINFSSGKSFSVRLNNPSTTTNKTLQYIHNEYETNNVYLDSAMESGAQKLQLVGTNSTGTYILNQTDISISLLDANGFALYADKYNNVCPKESVIITAISPQNSTLTISTAPIKRYNFTGSKTIEIKGERDYTASLDTQGNQNKLISIFVNSSCVLNPVESEVSPSTPQTMNNIVKFLSMPAFWGILIFVFTVIAVAWKAPAAVGMVAVIISNLEALIGLWAPYTIYVFIITWIIAAIFFTLGRNSTTGGNR